MSLPADEKRCAGRHIPGMQAFPFPEVAPECLECQRRTDRSDFPLNAWMGAPDESPCPMRIEPEVQQ